MRDAANGVSGREPHQRRPFPHLLGVPMDLGLNGKRALVLSSSRGLGLGIAQSLAREGADVMLTARSEDKLRAAADSINAAGAGRASFLAADLKTDAEKVHRSAIEALGGPI